MRLYKIEPYFDGERGEARYLTAWDEDDARKQIEETGVLEYDCYSVGYNIVEIEDLGAELVRGKHYGIKKSMLW